MGKWLLCLMIVGASDASAEVTAIFRKSDRLYVGKVTPPQPVEVEVQNIVKSSLGGAPEDYVAVPMGVERIPSKQRPLLRADLTVEMEPYPDPRQPARNAAKAKLRALGFTDEDFDALGLP